MKMLKNAARLALLTAALMTAASQVAVANTTRTAGDACSTDCGATGGSCSASTSWYNFWDECTCKCGSAGTALCDCN